MTLLERLSVNDRHVCPLTEALTNVRFYFSQLNEGKQRIFQMKKVNIFKPTLLHVLQ